MKFSVRQNSIKLLNSPCFHMHCHKDRVTLFFTLNAVFDTKFYFATYIYKTRLPLRFGFTVLGHYFPFSSETGQCYCSYLTNRSSFVKTYFFADAKIFSSSHGSQLFCRKRTFLQSVVQQLVVQSLHFNEKVSPLSVAQHRVYRVIILHSRAPVSVACKEKGNVLV